MLDVELIEIPNWICCGASSARVTSELLSLALPVHNLLLAREMGLDIAVCCAACYNRLRTANEVVRSNAHGRVHLVDEVVCGRYRGETQLKHLLEIVAYARGLDALCGRMSRDLSGLQVAAYYGCLLLRPPEIVAFDDPEHPTSMHRLIAAPGAQAVECPYKPECCGANLSMARTDIVLNLYHDILQKAAAAEADCFVVACPLCHTNLDMRQKQVHRRYKTDASLPVLYFTQLIGLALDLGAQDLAMQKLMVKPNRLLDRWCGLRQRIWSRHLCPSIPTHDEDKSGLRRPSLAVASRQPARLFVQDTGIFARLDGSFLAECVLPHVVSLATLHDTPVTLLRVLDGHQEDKWTSCVDPLDLYLDGVIAEACLAEVAERLSRVGVLVETMTSSGPAAEQIIACARRSNVDLIVMSSHGRSSLSAWNVSSVTQKVALRASRSVMVVRTHRPSPAGQEPAFYGGSSSPLMGRKGQSTSFLRLSRWHRPTTPSSSWHTSCASPRSHIAYGPPRRAAG